MSTGYAHNEHALKERSKFIQVYPSIKLRRYMENTGINDVTIMGKLEYLNLAGSVKDRIALITTAIYWKILFPQKDGTT